ncbi:MAG: hypothetical protein B7Y36_02380 [Novosphingobium sp. 28-62-57]|uniref:hypothetical protein n=1 Tax=unclassified Novosphingobium TaxID=2644732 RepID=UPI000BCFCB1F|nr:MULTISPECIES: hypothetical protein [unclassified Novosphingobium]OYW49651.1 MAG: hypothetical protein B7Z34_08230 [Novosphingobium sp. 12-62-10]OYZ12392.1 MAG: hypothetical protein B7Y36_02380 [Novosphingobium sp. 28-62-57]OZA36049.1 MAG: hypothetical protein B7X92_07920 [Novosphingobium sp. 17-62-9]HQS69580.1 hypothetical protein [Novosphingobium sp.]
MSETSRIIPLDGAKADTAPTDSHEAQAVEQPLLRGEDHESDVLQTLEPRPDRSWLAAAMAGVLIAAWTAVFAWAVIVPQTAATSPDQWVWWVSQWSVPVALILMVFLLIMRTSRREADRFADVTQQLARESRSLELRLSSMNTELALARDFIAAQSRDLETLGRMAVERLSSSATQLDNLVGQNSKQIDRIADVSSAALDNMEKLRGQLPVIANTAKDVTNNIGNAGRTAHLQLEELVSGFQRLNEFGLASERQVASVRERIDASVASFSEAAEDLAALAESRFDALAMRSSQHHEAITAAENAAISAWEDRSDAHVTSLRDALQQLAADHQALLTQSANRLAQFEQEAMALTAALGEEALSLDQAFAARRVSAEAEANLLRQGLDQRLSEIDAAIAERREAMEAAAALAAETLASQLGQLDTLVSEQRERQAAKADALAEQFAQIGATVSAFTTVLASTSEEGVQAATAINRSVDDLNGRLANMRQTLAGTDSEIGDVTDSAVRLLELIQAGSDHARTQIPEALRSTEAGLKGLENRVFTLRDTLREAGDGGRALKDALGSARSEVDATVRDLQIAQEALVGQAGERQAHISALLATLAKVKAESAALSHEVEERLSGAIAHLTEAATKTGTDLRDAASGEIAAIAEQLGEQSNVAIARVLQGRAAELVGRLEEAIDAAANASRDTAVQMRDQLAKIDVLAANLEARVSRAREKAEEQIDNDFARRAALITESLNSSAIDIAKALSSDVSETAWASYLRGDRGIFTRRAVSLLDNAEAKAVQSHYESEAEFREHVNRYIHDFESMLRQLLSTRDGNALGVTLLSSDMGKLYVALAQGIERLRT